MRSRTEVHTLLKRAGGCQHPRDARTAWRGLLPRSGRSATKIQVAIAKTLGRSCAERGRGGHLQVPLDKNRQSARPVSEGLAVLAHRRLATALAESRDPAAGASRPTSSARPNSPTPTRPTRRCPRTRRHTSPSCAWSTAPSVAVLRHPGDELRGGHVLAEVADEGVPDRVDTPVRPQVAGARAHRAQRGMPVEESRACLRAFATGRPSRSTSIATSGSRATCSSGTTPAPCTACCRTPASDRLMHRTTLAGEEPLE